MIQAWNFETRIYVLEFLLRSRARAIDPETLDKIDNTEHDFVVSPYDLLYNLIEVRRAKRAAELSLITRPLDRDIKLHEVGEL